MNRGLWTLARRFIKARTPEVRPPRSASDLLISRADLATAKRVVIKLGERSLSGRKQLSTHASREGDTLDTRSCVV
jgi:hypothetical protein